MAIEWYRIDTGLKTHPKRTRVHKLVGCSKLEAFAHITLLYTFAASHAEDGRVDKYAPAEIEEACEWEGVEGVLYDAFVKAKLIDESDDGKKIHNWYEKNWDHVKKKREKDKKYREDKASYGKELDPRPLGVVAEPTLRPLADTTNERTNEHTYTPQVPLRAYTRVGVEYYREEFRNYRSKTALYFGKNYHWTENDKKSVYAILSDNTDISKEKLENGFKNFFIDDPKYTGNHSARYFFGNINKYLTTTDTGAAGDGGFEMFWKAYPKKAGEVEARAEWARLNPDQGLKTVILEAVAQQCQSDQWRKEDGKYISAPAKWLKEMRWRDELKVGGEIKSNVLAGKDKESERALEHTRRTIKNLSQPAGTNFGDVLGFNMVDELKRQLSKKQGASDDTTRN